GLSQTHSPRPNADSSRRPGTAGRYRDAPEPDAQHGLAGRVEKAAKKDGRGAVVSPGSPSSRVIAAIGGGQAILKGRSRRARLARRARCDRSRRATAEAKHFGGLERSDR